MSNGDMIRGYKGLENYTKISRHTLKEWGRRGIIPKEAIFRPTKRSIFFNRVVIDQWLAGNYNQMEKATPDTVAGGDYSNQGVSYYA